MRTAPEPLEPPEAYGLVLARLVGLMACLGVVAAVGWWRTVPKSPPKPPVVVERPAPPHPVEVAQPTPAPPAPKLDHEAVARAEAELDTARRERIRAEARLAEASAALKAAATESAAQALVSKTLSSRVRDPSSRISRANERRARLRADEGRLKTELASLAQTPRPKRKSLIDRTPVAKPAEGNEYHFEVRRDRVSFIDLDRLLERVKADARLRIRMSDDGRPIVATVGPIGAFSLEYELARSMPLGIEDLLAQHGTHFTLRSWEVVPEYEGRGETFEMAFRPASEFARTINRLTPERSTITMWVYPDGFGLYRKLRGALHARGFVVAARPLPAGLTIRGSPAGSLSAGQ